jgi:uncharacterized protein (TIGR02996 family)
VPTAPSVEEQTFLDLILAVPDDDTPRLVFADWLDERGTNDDKARAALIRAQCRAELLPNSAERRRLNREAKAILKANQVRWTRPLMEAGIVDAFEFRRGFLDAVTVSATTFVHHAARLFELVPTIRSARFPNASNELVALARNRFFARLASVDLTRMCSCGYCGIDDELRTLFKSKNAHGLRSLTVSRDRIDASVARALARSAHLVNLTMLDLSNNPLGPDGAAELAKARVLGELQSLNLSNTDLRPEGAAALAAAKHWPKLTRLELSGNGVNGAGVAALVTAPFFGQLTWLDLSWNRIGEVGARALAGAETKLEHLDLTGARLGARAVKLVKGAFGKKVKL